MFGIRVYVRQSTLFGSLKVTSIIPDTWEASPMLVYGVEERRCCAETTRIPAIIPYAICKQSIYTK